MEVLDIVQLNNVAPYKAFNVTKDAHGIVVKINNSMADVLFFNPQNCGDYAEIAVGIADLKVVKEKLPKEMAAFLMSKMNKLIAGAKKKITPVKIKEYAMVELITESEEYAKFGVHKGDRGCVMENDAVDDYILVDFSWVDDSGDYYGDCISVKINDLKVID